MIIAGKYKGRLITRCCLAGKYHFNQQIGMSLGDHCFHSGYSCHTNGCDMNKIREITDEAIINEAIEEERLINEGSEKFPEMVRTFTKEDWKNYNEEQDRKREEKTKKEILEYEKNRLL